MVASVIGEKKLMPAYPDCSCIVINSANGQGRENNSWVLGRLMRDYPNWMVKAVKDTVQDAINASQQTPKPACVSLCVAVYAPRPPQPSDQRTNTSGSFPGPPLQSPAQQGAAKQSVPTRDWVSWSGVITILVQLGISGACVREHDWLPLAIAVAGNGLAYLPLVLLPWKAEKWRCRRKAKASFILTRGNGHQHAIVILGNRHGLHLEDLAAAHTPIGCEFKIPTVVFAALWILLLIDSTSIGSSPSSLWLLIIGAIGMLQNIIVAACRRDSGVNGIHLDFKECFMGGRVMDTLVDVEEKHANMWKILQGVFFPNRTRAEDQERFRAIDQRREEQDRTATHDVQRDAASGTEMIARTRASSGADLSLLIPRAGPAYEMPAGSREMDILQHDGTTIRARKANHRLDDATR